MCLYSSCNLVADSEFTSIVDSLVAPLSVINAIIASLFMKNYEKAVMNIEELEALWEDYQVYANDDIDVFKKS
jgi:DNA-binding MurR/RpiR family transcriptional regulator